MDRSANFWDRIAERYSRHQVADDAAYRKKLQVTREYFRPDMEVLELGCGTGSTAIAHAPYVKHIQAIDFSSKMIEIAQGKAKAGNIDNVTFVRSSIDELCVSDESVDAVLALNVLHLVNSKERLIARVYKMLKPGGIFVTSTACIGDAPKYVEIPLRIAAPIGRFLGLMPLVKIFTAAELEDGITTAGFTIDYRMATAPFIVAKRPD